jgi:hypothetical protein
MGSTKSKLQQQLQQQQLHLQQQQQLQQQHQKQLLELASAEKFQDNLCRLITEDIDKYMEKQSGVVLARLGSKIEANIHNVEVRIVNAVIANVTEHVLGRLEQRIQTLEAKVAAVGAEAQTHVKAHKIKNE